jgi:hypothetical protein
MMCDYYILKVLHIYYNKTDYLDFELNKERCYYYYSYDSDEENYKEKVSEYINDILTPKMKPIMLYENNNFIQLSFETKYKMIIDNEINTHNMRWSHIHKIVKVEERYERE